MKRKIHAGSLSVTLPIFVSNTGSTTGGGLSGLTSSTAGLVAEYRRAGASSWTTIPKVAGTLGTWSSGGLVADGALAGAYEFGVPNAALAAGVSWCIIRLRGAANMLPVLIEIELDAVNYQDATGFGLTALPAAVAGAAGGLPLGDAAGNVALSAAWLDTVMTWRSQVGNLTPSYRDFMLAAWHVGFGTLRPNADGTISALSPAGVEIFVYPAPTNIGALANDGAATLNLKQLNAVNSAGDAIVALSTGGNGRGIVATGNGTGDGIKAVAGLTGGVDIRGNITGNITGNLTGSAGSVTAPVTAGTVTDKTGYALANGAIGSLTFATGAVVPRVALVDTLTTYTGNTPQTGDSFARIGAPAGLTISADIQTRSTYAGGPVASVTSGVTVAINNDKGGYSLADASIATATFAAGATLPRVTLADTVTTYTGNTPQTGDSFARLGAPAGLSISADIQTRSTYAGGAVASVTAPVTVGTNNDKTGYTLASFGFTVNTTSNAIETAIKAVTDKFLFDASNFVKSNPQTSITVGDVTLAAAQPNYAPARPGDAMSLTTSERSSVATAVIADTTDMVSPPTGSLGAKVNSSAAAGDPLASAVPGAYGLGTAGHAIGAFLDAAITSRLATAAYTAPDNVSISGISAATTSIKLQTDKFLFDGSSNVKSNPQTSITVGNVTLAAAQPNYAPARVGDAMTLTTTERSAIATAVIRDTVDMAAPPTGSLGDKVNGAAAAGDPLASTVPGPYGLGTAGYLIGNFLNAAIDSRLAATDYTAPDNTNITAIADSTTAIRAQTDKFLFDASDFVKSNPQTSITVGDVVLATNQPNYAPARPGDAMTLTTAERTALGGDPLAIDLALAGYTGTQAGAILYANLDRKVSAGKLAADGLDAIPVETGVNARQALSPILAAAAGTLSGAGTGTIVINGGKVTTARITATTDTLGNRSVVTLSLPT